MNFWDEIKIVHMMVFFTRTSIADENNVFFSSVIGGENGKRKPKLSTMKTKKLSLIHILPPCVI